MGSPNPTSPHEPLDEPPTTSSQTTTIMRRGTIVFLVINLIIIGFLLNAFSTLISLLFQSGAADAIHRAEIPAPGSDMIENRTQLIPKIIHQTYINESIPERWQAGQQSCIDLHGDYEYILWTDAKSRDFIATEYPWALANFDSYNFPIQRADAIRYFILAHYGGIYIDLDDGCNRRLDPLLSYPAWARRTLPTGISNDAMGSVPQHPFFLHVIERLASYNRNWFMPYITVMYKGFSWSFFNISKGNSWHGKDAQTIFWMGKHWLLLTVAGFAIAGVVGVLLWWVCNVWIVRGKRTSGGRSRLPFWRRISGKERYELLDRMA